MDNDPNNESCEWQGCDQEGRYRIQTSANTEDIHKFCALHARTFDLSVVTNGPFIGAGGPNWTQKPQKPTKKYDKYEKPLKQLNPDIRMLHITENAVINYTKKDIENLKILGLDTGAKSADIRKAYKRLVKHCHPDQNPDLEHGEYIFTQINEAYNALKDNDII